MKFKQKTEAKYIVKNLNRRRLKYGFTLQDIADCLRVTKSMAAFIESGERTISESQKEILEDILA